MSAPAENQDEGQDAAEDAAPPKPAAPKMTLREQMEFLNGLRLRCNMTGPGRQGLPAEETILALDAEEIAKLGKVVETLDLFAIYRADKFVADKANRGRR